MAVKLVNGERILKSYDYAESKSKGLAGSKGSKTLVVTNRRIIHYEKNEGKGTSGTNVSEMPIEAAKYIRTSFKETRYPILLVFGILIALVGILLAFLSEAIIPFIICAVVATIFILIYAFKRTYAFACSIDTNTHITNAFGFSSISGDSRTAGLFSMFRQANKSFYIKVKVNSTAAQEMAEELGYIIAAAANGDFDEAETETEAE